MPEYVPPVATVAAWHRTAPRPANEQSSTPESTVHMSASSGQGDAPIPRARRRCPRCEGVLMGPARTCLVHGDQIDIGGRAPALETVADQLRKGRGQ